MKIRIDMEGAEALKPDFGMLREGLRVAQLTTPTALASSKARAAHDHSAALVKMFAGSKMPERKQAKGSFYPTLPPEEDDRKDL